ncbi:histidine kinase [Ideonella azotifigens]|uniref:histidine kinase n=1 Tax=Ideonella azotifigens TaxID=513160 RepID=A0ABN1JXL0_9BURK|nr:ATP-binding protein [Ideonella azotifigens]MCD2341326.1 histidine kinase [Ideonella azotifigens]
MYGLAAVVLAPQGNAGPTAMNTTNWSDSLGPSSVLPPLELERPPADNGGPGRTQRIAWRRQALLLAAVIGCLTVFMLARAMANNPHIAAEWRTTASGHLELADTPLLSLKPFVGRELDAVVSPDGEVLPFGVLTISHSARWITDDAVRRDLVKVRLATAQSLEAGQVTLRFRDGAQVELKPRPRGYGSLGAMFWLMSAFAMVLFLVGWIVPLVQPQLRNLLYAVMAHAQAAQLLLAAVASVPALALPSLMVLRESSVHAVLEAVTGAAIVHAASLHPARLKGRWLIAAAAWAATLAYALPSLSGTLTHDWWWGQSLLLSDGLVCIALLSWSHRNEPHPFAVVMRRFCVVTVATLALLTLAVSMRPHLPPEVQPVASVGPVIWGVFFASVVLLVPFISRSQNVMREFAMLAGISTIATSVDLLFVAVFSFSQFTSLTLSLFLALGAYAAIRQWLVSQMMGARALTTERMFQHLYRIAREVEARPERAADRMIELLRNVFEPLETHRSAGRAQQSRIAGNGAVLQVPLPNLTDNPTVDGMVSLRFAERGKRLFTQEDARLADRVLEQLMRALAHDRAVERGRSEERTRIAQDLHDDIGARLLTLMYKSQSKEMEEYVRHTLQDLKTLTRGLAAKHHPLALAAAEWKTDITTRLEAVRCELEWHAHFDQEVTLSMIQWSSLTRILRELVSNVISHSKASHVRIECRLHNGRFSFELADDGVGREPAKWSHGLGLGGIRKRVKLLNGTVRWQERDPVGTLCSVDIPQLVRPD